MALVVCWGPAEDEREITKLNNFLYCIDHMCNVHCEIALCKEEIYLICCAREIQRPNKSKTNQNKEPSKLIIQS